MYQPEGLQESSAASAAQVDEVQVSFEGLSISVEDLATQALVDPFGPDYLVQAEQDQVYERLTQDTQVYHNPVYIDQFRNNPFYNDPSSLSTDFDLGNTLIADYIEVTPHRIDTDSDSDPETAYRSFIDPEFTAGRQFIDNPLVFPGYKQPRHHNRSLRQISQVPLPGMNTGKTPDAVVESRNHEIAIPSF